MIDKFYTKIEVVKDCLKKIDIKEYNSIIEPSAGNGSFSNLLPKKNLISLDLFPENDNIIKMDFFDFSFKEELPCLVIGNPPFGKRSSLAIDFFNKASKFSSTIAFIVPLQFRKWLVQNKLSKNFWLEKDFDLPEFSFFYQDKEFNINCCFQIWHNKNFKEEINNLRIIKKPEIKHKDFELWQFNRTKEALKYFDKKIYHWNFAVPRQGFYDYKLRIIEEENLDKKIQWMFIKAKDEIILERLLKIDFEKLSKKNTTIPGFGKADLVKEYKELYGQD